MPFSHAFQSAPLFILILILILVVIVIVIVILILIKSNPSRLTCKSELENEKSFIKNLFILCVGFLSLSFVRKNYGNLVKRVSSMHKKTLLSSYDYDDVIDNIMRITVKVL